MPDNPQTQPVAASFFWIKQQLDPKAGYIVVENNLDSGGASILDESHTAYVRLRQQELTWLQVVDTDLNREYLVVRIPGGTEDQTLGRVMGFGFSKETVYYLFKAKEALT